jgi:S-DNA-T family DNA segregation ATPase FtsK/SpoIIIE
MPTKPANKSKKREVTTSFGPRTRAPKPIVASVLLLTGIMHLVACIDYRHKQEGFFESVARVTGGFGDLNLMGKLGADAAFVSLFYFGFIALLLGPLCFQWAYLLFLRRPKQITLLRVLGLILLLTGGTAFCSFTSLHFFPNLLESFPVQFFPSGLGGYFGELLYVKFLAETLGTFGSGLLLGVLSGLGLYLVFSNFLIGVTKTVLRFLKAIARAIRKMTPARRAQIPKSSPLATEDIPPVMKAKRGLLSPIFGKSLVDDELDNPLVLPDDSDPGSNDAYLEAMGKHVPQPQPIQKNAKSQRREKSPLPKSPSEAIPAKAQATARENHTTSSTGLKIVESAKTERQDLVVPKKRGKYQFPSIELIESSGDGDQPQTTNHLEVAERLKNTLEDFKIKVELGEVHIGPVITRYDLHPAPGIRVEKIAALEKNLTMALQAQSVRILAPVPGKGCVGIEIPNEHPQSVRVRDILETRVWTDSKAEIPIVLGKDVSGKPLVTDLTRMPHLLIAGSTGSGKTVCINAIICSLLYHSSPEDLRFIMVDPKIVEMKVFNDLPHMLIPVVTDPKRVPNALKWLISEMERRYQIFAKVGVRNIAGFNAKILRDRESRTLAKTMDAELTAEERAAVSQIEVERDDDALEIPEKKLPYIVCIIDELADLMMVAPADIETCVARLAQLARAAGIHLVIATQRPSVNVITGVIKANLPSRISFKVASKVDSRTILDGGGADTLIGRGDMLFIPPGIHHLVRAQGAFVSDDEIANIVDFLKVNGPPEILESVQKEIEKDGDDDGGPTTSADTQDWGDAMVPDAIEVLRSSQRASTSMLQRRLRIGYNRAARIMEILEDEGIVGPDNGSQPREILRDLNDL